jgi:hypothetical protein
MRYELIDSEGSTLGSFADVASAKNGVENLLANDPDASGELGVLAYDDEGRRRGSPLSAEEFLASEPAPPARRRLSSIEFGPLVPVHIEVVDALQGASKSPETGGTTVTLRLSPPEIRGDSITRGPRVRQLV